MPLWDGMAVQQRNDGENLTGMATCVGVKLALLMRACCFDLLIAAERQPLQPFRPIRACRLCQNRNGNSCRYPKKEPRLRNTET